MGNAADKGGNSLARNWKQAGPNSYRNLVTGELIDCFDIVAHSEMEMQEHNSLLMKRAALAHPNVPKLIYFCNSEIPDILNLNLTNSRNVVNSLGLIYLSSKIRLSAMPIG